MSTKVALDTSVVVAAMLPQHPRHGPCAGWLRRGEQGEITLTIAVHGIAESFATLTARAPSLMANAAPLGKHNGVRSYPAI